MDVDALVVCLVSYSIFHPAAKHHLGAVHEILHDVFQLWHKCLFVNYVEEDLGVCGDLDPRVTFDIIDESICVNLMVYHPFSVFCELINFNFEEQNLTGASDDERLLVDEIHVSQILFVDFLKVVVLLILVLRVFDNFHWDSERMALAIKGIDLIIVRVVVALLREVLLVAF